MRRHNGTGVDVLTTCNVCNPHLGDLKKQLQAVISKLKEKEKQPKMSVNLGDNASKGAPFPPWRGGAQPPYNNHGR